MSEEELSVRLDRDYKAMKAEELARKEDFKYCIIGEYYDIKEFLTEYMSRGEEELEEVKTFVKFCDDNEYNVIGRFFRCEDQYELPSRYDCYEVIIEDAYQDVVKENE